MGGLQTTEPGLAGDVIRYLKALTPRRVGATECNRLGDDPLYVPLTFLPLPDFFTFTRASDAFRRLPDGPGGARWVAMGGNDLPRISTPDGSPTRCGLLIEQKRINDAKRSRSLDANPPWTPVWAPTIVANAETSPDGTMTADTVEDTDVTEYGRVEQTAMALNLTNYSVSVFAKWISGPGGLLQFYDGAASPQVSISVVGDWVRIVGGPWLVVNGATAIIRLFPAYPVKASVGKFAFWMAQVEEGDYPSSPFAAGAAPATRQPDVCRINYAALGARLTPTAGRLRWLFIPDWASTEEDDRNFQWNLGADTSVDYDGGAWRIRSNGVYGVNLPVVHSRLDVYVLDWTWGGGVGSLDVWLNSVYQGRTSVTPWTPVGFLADFWFGMKDSSGTRAAGGTFRALVIG